MPPPASTTATTPVSALPLATTVARIHAFLARHTDRTAGDTLAALVAAGLDQPPLPGHGATLLRWQILAALAGHDLSLVKLYEGHTDALAILAELGGPAPTPASRWGVWCAEAPGALRARHATRASVDGMVVLRLDGRKSWCSGAAGLTHALVSCRDGEQRPLLAAVALTQPGVRVTDDGWHAVGMAGSASVDVAFDEASAVQVGQPGAYLSRPGFWHGGAGIAACWYGAARALALTLHQRLQAAPDGADPHRLAQLGRIDIALAGSAALLRQAANDIDRMPGADAMALALRARLAVEAAASDVLALATRALGAGPLCRDAWFARMAADLPVFLRQSHAEHDLAALGANLARQESAPWAL